MMYYVLPVFISILSMLSSNAAEEICLDLFLQYAALCSFLHKHLKFTKENVRCILHAYQAPQELYRLLPASGFQFPGAYA